MSRIAARVFVLVLMTAGLSATAAPTAEASLPDGGRFVTTWHTESDPTVHLRLGGQVDVAIDWGDGTTQRVSGYRDRPVDHTYDGGPPTHQVTVVGTFDSFGDGIWHPYGLISVDEWGETGTTNLRGAFFGARHLTHIEELPTGVTNMSAMFVSSAFNEPIGDWDVSQVTNMSGMFANSLFNQPIGAWDVSNVTDMSSMFEETPFNQPIGRWDVSNVTDMNWMFDASLFDRPIGGWDVSNVTEMFSMFSGGVFNQPIGGWDVSGITEAHGMWGMFWEAQSFNQDLSAWCVPTIPDVPGAFDLDARVWDRLRPVWGTCGGVSTGPDTIPPKGEFTTSSGPSGVLRLAGAAWDNRGVRNVAVAVRNPSTGKWLRRDGSWGAFQKLHTMVAATGSTWTGWKIRKAVRAGTYGVTLFIVDTSANRNLKPRPWQRVKVS